MRRAFLLASALVACTNRHEPQPRGHHEEPTGGPQPQQPAPVARDRISRVDFNRFAVRQNLPIYWIADANHDRKIDPFEVAALLFYPSRGNWVKNGVFTSEFDKAYEQIVAAAMAAPTQDARIALVEKDLDQGRATLVRTDSMSLAADDRPFVEHMLKVAALVDEIFEQANGATALADKLPADPQSRSLFRRNRGPKCVAPATEKDPNCSAIPGAPKPIVDIYPASLQTSDAFCKDLEARPDAVKLLEPFTVVRVAANGKDLEAVPYSAAYKLLADQVASELEAAAATVKDPAEAPLVGYLRAAASGFRTNDWLPADETWSKMTVDNSKWYVRVGPDEVYWEPCSHKAGFHVTFARINQGSRQWQQKLVPIQKAMEAQVAARAGAPYKERAVTFHLPDFIDIVVNAGDDRTPLGATIGQSLPNWGPVANEGRGRTVAMVNLYQDDDSRAARREQAASVLDADSIAQFTGEGEPSLLITILHEATHNLGPAHQYKVNGKTAVEIFGGAVASVLEELKAQTGGLFLIEMLRGKGIITDAFAKQAYADGIVWALGWVSQGMYEPTGKRKTYANVAAVQIGFLIDAGAIAWDDKAKAANGKDTGALVVHYDKLVAACDDMMKMIGGIKARGDKAAADALLAKYVDGKVVPHAQIQERFLRFPKASFVYSVATM
jgi:hypothetical protein